MDDRPTLCKECGVYYYNADHICVEYDESFPCEECGAGTVYVFVSAPGTGSGRTCSNGHYVGTCRELSIWEVI